MINLEKIDNVVFLIENFMGFSIVHLVSFFLSSKKGYTKKRKYSFFEKIVKRRLYNRIMNNLLETVEPELLFGS